MGSFKLRKIDICNYNNNMTCCNLWDTSDILCNRNIRKIKINPQIFVRGNILCVRCALTKMILSFTQSLKQNKKLRTVTQNLVIHRVDRIEKFFFVLSFEVW